MPPDKKAPKVESPNLLQEVTYLLVGLMLFGGVYLQLRSQFYAASDLYGASTAWAYIVNWLRALWSVWKFYATILTGAGLVWAAYSLVRLKEIEKEEEKIYGGVETGEAFLDGADEKRGNEKWERVLELTNSINPSDWKVAIIEADIMLEELLRASSYDGDGVGEMLKQVEPSDMLTLDAAWEAHKVRNRIAHAGPDFELNERETKRVISLFESVFKEFKII